MKLINSYNKIAKEYTERFFNALDQMPKDRELLDNFAKLLGPRTKVCDLGCGPGQIANYLHNKGLNSFGIDISPGMVEEAGKLNPDINFEVGDILSLKLPDGELDGITAFYSLIHIPKQQLPLAFAEINRVLRPGGLMLFSFHIGEETIHFDEWWGYPVNLDVYFFNNKEIRAVVTSAGLKIREIVERDPYNEEIEYQSRRSYFLVEKLQSLV